MKIYKRIQFKKREIQKLQEDCEDYVWAAVDTSKCVISLGDDYLADLRDVLLIRRCMPENIFGVGVDLGTGRVDFVAQINRRNPTVGADGELSRESKADVKKTLRYFFEKSPVFQSPVVLDDDTDDYDDIGIAFR